MHNPAEPWGAIVTREARRAARRLGRYLKSGRVRFTDKALVEIATLRIQPADALEVLSGLGPDDFDTLIRSTVTGEALHVFRWEVQGLALYIKLALRGVLVVISFHEERDDEEGQSED